jgi:16S rRNA (cytidine1402-2'-O)-methyltransferase
LEHFGQEAPRGEFVIVVEGTKTKAADIKPDFSDISLEKHVEYYIQQGHGRMEAMKLAAKDRGLSKREVYSRLNV